jgi:hypothetical protein
LNHKPYATFVEIEESMNQKHREENNETYRWLGITT